MPRTTVAFVVLVLAVSPASAQRWSITYEPNAGFPEESGWQRAVNGGGAQRYVEGGSLILDGLASADIVDLYRQYMPSHPAPGEVFRMEWRLRVDELHGFCDPTVDICFGQRGDALFIYQADWIYSVSEGSWIANFTAGVFHDYVFTSSDLSTYALYIDGVLAHTGRFSPGTRNPGSSGATECRGPEAFQLGFTCGAHLYPPPRWAM